VEAPTGLLRHPPGASTDNRGDACENFPYVFEARVEELRAVTGRSLGQGGAGGSGGGAGSGAGPGPEGGVPPASAESVALAKAEGAVRRAEVRLAVAAIGGSPGR